MNTKYHVVRCAPLWNETIKLQNVKKQKHGVLGAATAAYTGERGAKGSVVVSFSPTTAPRARFVMLSVVWRDMASSTNGNIVVEWLRSLHLGQYAESFIDNGYDDLEICKQVGEPDLDAIGVLNPAHRQRLLHSVRSLREEGAAAVYFTLEEAAAARDPCRCEEEARKEQATAAVEPAKYVDEYEEGKAELVKIPRMQLKRLLRERLAQDGIRLSLQPYSTTVSV